MRGPLKEQIQNAINRALKESIASSNQAAYINVGGRRRNRKKKKNKKNSGVTGSAWSIVHFQADVPPARCRLDSLDVPPKAKGGSPQVTKAKKTCKDLKARLSPPRSCVKDALEADDKPLIGNEAAEDENEAAKDNQAIEADQENIDPNNMPLSSLFKTTKGKKSKSKKSKNKDKDVTDTHAIDDVTSKQDAQAEEETPTTTATPQASDVTETSLSNDVAKAEEIDLAEKVEGVQEGKEDDVTVEQAPVSSTDIKMDETAEGEDSAVALDTTTTTPPDDLALREGPQLSPSEGGTVETQPAKADGSLPPESAGREKQSLLHDHNPEGMVCCVIL